MSRTTATVVLVCALALAVVAVPTARRIRTKTSRAHMSARSSAHTDALARAFTCRNDFIGKDPNNPLRQDAAFYTFCADSLDATACTDPNKKKPFTVWKAALKDTNHLSQMGLKKMLEWQTTYAQNSFRFMIIAASKAMSGWSKLDEDWWAANKNEDLPVVRGGEGWPNQALIGKPKGMGSAWRKVKDDTDTGYHYDFTRLADGLRASFVFADPAHVEKAVCWFRNWVTEDKVAKAHECAIVQDKDRWTVPIDGGYKDFMLNMACKWGKKNDDTVGYRKVIVEVQFHACGVLMAKQGDVKSINEMMKSVPNAPHDFEKNGHGLYEAARKLKAPDDNAKIAELNNAMSLLYTNAALVAAGKCDIKKAPKFYWEGGAGSDEANDYEEEDLTEEVAKLKKFDGVNAANYHAIGWNFV